MDIKKMYIDGIWMLSEGGNTREIINPASEEIIAIVTEGEKVDVRKAVKSAKRAFYKDGWKNVKAVDRADLLFRLADEIDKIKDEFIEIELKDNGKPLREVKGDIDDAIACLKYYAGIVSKPHGTTYEVPDSNMQSMVVREPIGVCGQIVPWNYPLLMAVWKLAPAIAAGNTVIFKPSEITPLSAIKLFEVIDKVGFPNGVLNLVLGAGPIVGNEIASNTDIDKVAFTGGTETGKSIMIAATANIKNISLELGGKSPNIVFADSDFDTAIDYALFGIFLNQGQVCSAGSRLILEDKIYDKFIRELAKKAEKIKVTSGDEEGCEMGPLISKEHMNKVLNYIEIGIEEGAKLLCGGERLDRKGYFVKPTIFYDTKSNMRIVKEEIFGPVLVIQKFSTEEEALELANDTIYGLAGGVFTSDGAKAMRVVKGLRAGITWINTYHPTFNEAPWGGYKQSGIGRELGTFGLEEYTEVKQININLRPEPIDWFNN